MKRIVLACVSLVILAWATPGHAQRLGDAPSYPYATTSISAKGAVLKQVRSLFAGVTRRLGLKFHLGTFGPTPNLSLASTTPAQDLVGAGIDIRPSLNATLPLPTSMMGGASSAFGDHSNPVRLGIAAAPQRVRFTLRFSW